MVSFIQQFLSRKGGLIFFSTVWSRGLNFLTVFILVRFILQKEDYGLITYAASILSFILPFAGAGIGQGLLRYGSQMENEQNKTVLFQYVLKKGTFYSFFIMLILILAAPIIVYKLPGSYFYLIVLAFQMVSLFWFELLRTYARIIHNNKVYSTIGVWNYTLLFIANVICAYLFGPLGYVLSMSLVPLVVAVGWGIRMKVLPNLWVKFPIEMPEKEFISYGLYSSLGGVASQLLYAVDILIITYVLANAELLAQYKVSSLIPLSLLMLPASFMTADFVTIAREYRNPVYLRNYFRQFASLFLLISVVFFVLVTLLASWIMNWFGPEYAGYSELITIFSFGLIGGMTFRVPLGNMLLALGWAKVNTAFSLLILLMNVVLSYFAVVRLGVVGAAYVTAGLMWLSGILSYIAFEVYLRRLDGKHS